MRYVFFILVIIVIANCKTRNKCSFRTVEELDQADIAKCFPEDSAFFTQLRQFSGGYNILRKTKGIPVLPPGYTAELFTDEDAVRWHGDVDVKGRFIEMGKPYLKWKTVKWNNDSLIYDRSLFIEGKNDRWGKTLVIYYDLDTTAAKKGYTFYYEYSPGQNYPDVIMTRQQADSVLKVWKIDY